MGCRGRCAVFFLAHPLPTRCGRFLFTRRPHHWGGRATSRWPDLYLSYRWYRGGTTVVDPHGSPRARGVRHVLGARPLCVSFLGTLCSRYLVETNRLPPPGRHLYD